MRWFEIASGVRLPVSCEEQELLDTVSAEPVPQDGMDERSEELARQMVGRGVLNHYTKNGRVHYRPNSAKDIPRDR